MNFEKAFPLIGGVKCPTFLIVMLFGLLSILALLFDFIGGLNVQTILGFDTEVELEVEGIGTFFDYNWNLRAGRYFLSLSFRPFVNVEPKFSTVNVGNMPVFNLPGPTRFICENRPKSAG